MHGRCGKVHCSWIGMWRVRRNTLFILRENGLLIYLISVYAIRIKIQFCIRPSINPRVLTRLLFAKDLWVRKSDRSFQMVIRGIILSPASGQRTFSSGAEEGHYFWMIINSLLQCFNCTRIPYTPRIRKPPPRPREGLKRLKL